jgi:hypothetical protein
MTSHSRNRRRNLRHEARRDTRPRLFCRATLCSAAERVRRVLRSALATLREIFDEAAYTRFLTRQQIESSPSAYAAFWREHEAAKARRPRCC